MLVCKMKLVNFVKYAEAYMHRRYEGQASESRYPHCIQVNVSRKHPGKLSV
jgi:hypothetical protein